MDIISTSQLSISMNFTLKGIHTVGHYAVVSCTQKVKSKYFPCAVALLFNIQVFQLLFPLSTRAVQPTNGCIGTHVKSCRLHILSKVS